MSRSYFRYRAAFLAAGFLAGGALASPGFAADPVMRDVVITGHRFEPAEIHVPANQPVELRVKNQDETPEEFESKALKAEKVIPGKAEGIIRIRPLPAGRYTFQGEYNSDTAQGVVIAE